MILGKLMKNTIKEKNENQIKNCVKKKQIFQSVKLDKKYDEINLFKICNQIEGSIICWTCSNEDVINIENERLVHKEKCLCYFCLKCQSVRKNYNEIKIVEKPRFVLSLHSFFDKDCDFINSIMMGILHSNDHDKFNYFTYLEKIGFDDNVMMVIKDLKKINSVFNFSGFDIKKSENYMKYHVETMFELINTADYYKVWNFSLDLKNINLTFEYLRYHTFNKCGCCVNYIMRDLIIEYNNFKVLKSLDKELIILLNHINSII